MVLCFIIAQGKESLFNHSLLSGISFRRSKSSLIFWAAKCKTDTTSEEKEKKNAQKRENNLKFSFSFKELRKPVLNLHILRQKESLEWSFKIKKKIIEIMTYLIDINCGKEKSRDDDLKKLWIKVDLSIMV